MKFRKFALMLGALALGLVACNDTDEEYSPLTGQTVIIDGTTTLSVDLHTPAGESFPTHLPLVPVVDALGSSVEWNEATGNVSLMGRSGPISFTVGSGMYTVGGQVVNMPTSIIINDEVYVPIRFFRDAFGMGSSVWMSGHVHIDTHGMDDMH